MQTTLRLDDSVYRQAKAEAARLGVTLTKFIEEALQHRISKSDVPDRALEKQAIERDQLMEALLLRTAHFRMGAKPTREEMNER